MADQVYTFPYQDTPPSNPVIGVMYKNSLDEYWYVYGGDKRGWVKIVEQEEEDGSSSSSDASDYSTSTTSWSPASNHNPNLSQNVCSCDRCVRHRQWIAAMSRERQESNAPIDQSKQVTPEDQSSKIPDDKHNKKVSYSKTRKLMIL